MTLIEELKDIRKEFHDLMIEAEFMNKGYILGKMYRIENRMDEFVNRVEKNSEEKQ